MIGNDIVDLQYAAKESNWKRPGFLAKVFTAEEQDSIRAAENPDLTVWLLWSRKESVYKIIARKEQRQFYAPKNIFSVNINENEGANNFRDGQMIYAASTYRTRSFFQNNYIHTIAYPSQEGEPEMFQGSFDLGAVDCQNQSKQTREKLLLTYCKYSNRDMLEVSIQTCHLGIPYIYYKNKKQPATISMAHHGRYGGFVLK